MDSVEPVTDDAAWMLAAAYIDAWNRRDREAWLDLLHAELEFRPTALVGTHVVYRGVDEAGRYFDALIASERPEQADVAGLQRLAPERFLMELELVVDGSAVATACVVFRVRGGKFVETAGYLSDAQTLTATHLLSEEAVLVPRPGPALEA